jgi:hypothetical protein
MKHKITIFKYFNKPGALVLRYKKSDLLTIGFRSEFDLWVHLKDLRVHLKDLLH